MKTSHKFLALSLLTLALSGCSSCPCKKECAMETKAPVAAAPVQAVTAPATTQVVQETTPVVAAPAKKIPAAVLK